ncbi:MAG: hypothetical protein FJ102_16215 [Deltaproteobacteria bacterium]|nr:hypothetical protein [Deltaproteobacteria bacterium]
MATVGLIVAAGLAWADDAARDWGTLHDALLVEVADGTPMVAEELYRELLDERKPSDPLYGAVAYWLGRNRVLAGAVDDGTAFEALSAAVADPSLRPAALTLLVAADLRRHEIKQLPAEWTFETGTFPAVRVRPGGKPSDLGVRRDDGRVVLAWTTTVRPGEPDGLGLRLAAGLELDEIRFSARALDRDAVLRVTARDDDGGAWHSDDLALAAGAWREVSLQRRDLAADPGTRGPVALRRVSELSIEDVSGERGAVRGEHTLLLDDVRLR